MRSCRKESGQNRNEDGVHRAQQEETEPVSRLIPAFAGRSSRNTRKADGKENRPVAFFHGGQRMTQAQDEERDRRPDIKRSSVTGGTVRSAILEMTYWLL